MNLITVIGARPQFIKAAVVSNALKILGIDESIVHTGQHYDSRMSEVFWDQLKIPKPYHNLNVGSFPHGTQTALIMKGLEELLLSNTLPDALLVYGDTNSTIAGALVAAKLHVPVIHIESGLRSFNRSMPEEINRIVTDHISSLLFCSSEDALKLLDKEGITENVFVVGDVMLDAFNTFSKQINDSNFISILNGKLKDSFVLMTIHRPSNTDSKHALNQILDAIREIPSQVVWPVHPRNHKLFSNLEIPTNLLLVEPVSYFDMLYLIQHCYKIITDSGGLQKEAYWAKKQCITVRDETEWVETLLGNWNQLVGPNTARILAAYQIEPATEWAPLYGDGKASKTISSIIKKQFS